MKNKSILKRIITFMLAFAMVFGCMQFTKVDANACENKTQTIFFVDNTCEQWVKNDNAVMVAVDNTNGHQEYIMTKVNDSVWACLVPANVENITFNRVSPDMKTQWNSWSAGSKDGMNSYFSEGHEFGHWGTFIY